MFLCSQDPTLFQVVFVLCNGPLATAIIMWHNSLVFHDWDKMTSVCIHLLPALVTFARRWLAPFGTEKEEEEERRRRKKEIRDRNGSIKLLLFLSCDFNFLSCSFLFVLFYYFFKKNTIQKKIRGNWSC